MVLTTPSTSCACCLGTPALTLRRKCTLQRCEAHLRALREGVAQSLVGVGDDQLHPMQPAADQAAADSNQKLSLSLAPFISPSTLFSPVSRTPTAMTVAWLNSPTLAHLVVRRVEPHYGYAPSSRPRSERSQLLVELTADPAHLALADTAAAHGRHQCVDLAVLTPSTYAS